MSEHHHSSGHEHGSCGCGSCGCHSHSHDHEHEDGGALWMPILSALLLLLGLTASFFHFSPFAESWVRFLFYVVAFLPVGLPVMKEAWEAACHGDVFSEFMLMSVASVGAFAIGEYPEAVAVMLLYCIGEAFQEQAVVKAKSHIKTLVSYRPDKAKVLRNNAFTEVSPDEVLLGEVIEVLPGERVPLDGVLSGETCDFNTSAITGESVPRSIVNGGEVLAGMVPYNRTVRITVTRSASQSALSRILAMVEEAAERKAPTERFVRRFARIYTPIVIALAVLTVLLPWLYSWIVPSFAYVFGTWFHRALVFLVISCPCALVISVPLSYFTGIGKAATQGILFKGGQFLDAVANIRTVVFDKTGTLTTGRFSVVDDASLSSDACKMLATMEVGSTHPIAQAIVEKYRPDMKVETETLPGLGLKSVLDGDIWLAGNAKLMTDNGISPQLQHDRTDGTVVHVSKNGTYCGFVRLEDTLKYDAAEGISALKAQGVARVEVLSGDRQFTVDRVVDALKLTRGHGELLPQEKMAHLENLCQEAAPVAYVGDGINDAPVLTRAHVGFAMGRGGTDMAVEVADVVLQTDHISGVATAIAIGKRTRAIVRQNIVMAIGIKLLVMFLGLCGVATLWEAVFADSGVALLAVLNALRIFRTR